MAIVLGLTTQQELPRPALADDGSFSFPNTRSQARYRWVGSIDRAHLYGDLVNLLGRNEGRGDGRPSTATPARCVGWMCREPCPVPGG